MLAEQIYPSTSYLIPAYPKCNAWYDCFAPFGNVVAVESATKKSIIDVAQSNLITLEVQLDWTGGPHSAPFPVCSSDGVSYAAVIRLDYYYEVQEKKCTSLGYRLSSLSSSWKYSLCLVLPNSMQWMEPRNKNCL